MIGESVRSPIPRFLRMKLSQNEHNLLTELLLDWEEAFEKGREISPEDLCCNHIHLLEAAIIAIQTLKLSNWKKPPLPPTFLNTDSTEDATGLIEIATILKKRFRIDEILGFGGQGIVYKAFDLQLKRFVAIKTTKSLSNLPSKDRQALLEEAQKIASLTHPGIVPIFDILEFHDSYLFISEYLDGGDFGKALKEKSLTQIQIVIILKEIAIALNHAHNHGIIHRDIKPSNILLTKNLNAKICDFGIAFQHGNTVPMEPIGSLDYASPEQIKGENQTSATDIWSMGVILFEAFTNNLPFHDPNPQKTLIKAFNTEEPLMINSSPEIPKKMMNLIVACLNKVPEKRPSSASILAYHLNRLEMDLNPANKRRKLLIKLILLLTGVGLSVFILRKSGLQSYFFAKGKAKKPLAWPVNPETTSFLNPRINRLEHYLVGDRMKWEQSLPTGFTGKPHAHNIAFKHPLKPGFTLHFQLTVLSGIRVRVIFGNWDFFLGNEGFTRTISVYGKGKTAFNETPYRYRLQEKLNCKLFLNSKNYSLHINNQLTSAGSIHPQQSESVILQLSSGDPFSPGEVLFSDFILEEN